MDLAILLLPVLSQHQADSALATDTNMSYTGESYWMSGFCT